MDAVLTLPALSSSLGWWLVRGIFLSPYYQRNVKNVRVLEKVEEEE
jgi:hypothetical protein